MKEISIKSFAKINIGLNVISKREDGYHNLETVFYPLQLHDVIKFSKSDIFKFSSNSNLLNSEKQNLITSAISILENYTNKRFLVEIDLDKRIPLGAGLGGGSSNAAYTLKAINELFELNISIEELRNLALRLGSDVPLFLYDLPAYAESRGEKLIKISFRIDDKILIVNPKIHISTKWAFSKITPKPSQSNLKEILEKHPRDYKIWQEKIKNDFEEVALSEFKELKELKNTLVEIGSNFCIMTGSGSTFIAVFNDQAKLDEAISFAEQRNYFTYVETPN